MIKYVLAWLQFQLYMLGLRRAASVLSRSSDESVRPTPQVAPNEVQHGEGWSLTELSTPGPLRAIEFDHTFNDNAGVDINRDIMIPLSRLDIN